MSSLTAAVFTPRLHAYRKTGRRPATTSSPLSGFHLTPMLHVQEQHLSLKGLTPQAPLLNDDRKHQCFIVCFFGFLTVAGYYALTQS